MANGILRTVDTPSGASIASEEGSKRARPFIAVPVIRALLWMAGFLGALWLCVQWGGGTGVHNDFTQNVWLPSRLVMDGANPYLALPGQVDASLGQYRSAFDGFNSGSRYYFIYPMWLALLMSPFAVMPLAAATALWRALNLVLLVWGIGAILRASNSVFRSWKPVAAAATGMTILLGVVYRESILTLYIGQFAIIELGLLAAIWGWLLSSGQTSSRGRLLGDSFVGLALAVLATKPQAVGLPIVLIVLWALSRRRFAIPVSAVLGLSLLLLGPTLFYPHSVQDWLMVIIGGGQAASQAEVSASVWGLSYQWLGEQSPWRIVAVLLTIVGVAALLPRWWGDLKDKASPIPLSLLPTICMNSIISPYMLGYEHVVLLLPALAMLASAGLPGNQPQSVETGFKYVIANPNGRKWLRLTIYLWLAILPYFIVIIQAATQKEYPAVIQSGTMLAFCWWVKLKWQGSEIRDQTSRFTLPSATRN